MCMGGLNNNQSSHVSLVSGVYMNPPFRKYCSDTATGLKYMRVHIVLVCSTTLWMTLLSSSLKLSVVFIVSPEEEPEVSGTDQPVLRWSPQQPLQMYVLLCFMDQSLSPVMLLPPQSILDSAYINTHCLTNPYAPLIGLQAVLHSHW